MCKRALNYNDDTMIMTGYLPKAEQLLGVITYDVVLQWLLLLLLLLSMSPVNVHPHAHCSAHAMYQALSNVKLH